MKQNIKNIVYLVLIALIIVPMVLGVVGYKEGMETVTETEESTEETATTETTETTAATETTEEVATTETTETAAATETTETAVESETTTTESETITETPGENVEVVQNETDPGIVPSNINYVDRILSDEEGQHMYCLGGNVFCKYENADLQYVSMYGDKTGKTYQNTCTDGTPVMCNSKMYADDVNMTKFYVYNHDKEEVVSGTDISYTESATNKGFTQKLNYTPLDLSDGSGNITYYMPNGDNHLTNRCALFESEDCIQKKVEKETSEKETSEEETSKDCSNNDIQIKCLAHYGTKIGDPLCCGQTGVLQNTNNICPEELPVCSGYKCGSQWGVCMKSDNVNVAPQ